MAMARPGRAEARCPPQATRPRAFGFTRGFYLGASCGWAEVGFDLSIIIARGHWYGMSLAPAVLASPWPHSVLTVVVSATISFCPSSIARHSLREALFSLFSGFGVRFLKSSVKESDHRDRKESTPKNVALRVC